MSGRYNILAQGNSDAKKVIIHLKSLGISN